MVYIFAEEESGRLIPTVEAWMDGEIEEREREREEKRRGSRRGIGSRTDEDEWMLCCRWA